MGSNPESRRGSRSKPAYESSIKRLPASRESRNRLLVCCNAARTEGDYLRGLRDHAANPAVTVKFRPKACSPLQLVQFAVEERERQEGEFDQVWCVFDVDQYPDVSEAVRTAEAADVRVALSNPCFEIWLILHFATHTAAAATYRQLLPVLKKCVPGYDKARLRFRDYQDTWPQAVERARRLAESGTEHRTNPSTGVWRLVEEITGRSAILGGRPARGVPGQRSGLPAPTDYVRDCHPEA